jgi:hypothetical protein
MPREIRLWEESYNDSVIFVNTSITANKVLLLTMVNNGEGIVKSGETFENWRWGNFCELSGSGGLDGHHSPPGSKGNHEAAFCKSELARTRSTLTKYLLRHSSPDFRV